METQKLRFGLKKTSTIAETSRILLNLKSISVVVCTRLGIVVECNKERLGVSCEVTRSYPNTENNDVSNYWWS